MDQAANGPSLLSDPSPQSLLEPLPASELLKQEIFRKESLHKKGNPKTGCTELDEYVLRGGFERGSVVGLSAEDDEAGMLIGLQTIAHTLASAGSSSSPPRAMVITTLPATVLLPKLRMALINQLSNDPQHLQRRLQEYFLRISIARIFDIDGLWEVLGELEAVAAAAEKQPQGVPGELEDEAANEQVGREEQPKTEVLDSEDEDGLSPLESPAVEEPSATGPTAEGSPASPLPDIILVTHTPTLLSPLFTGHDRQAAHDKMVLLSSHLHHFTRSPTLGGPLIMLLNSTTAPTFSQHNSDHNRAPPHGESSFKHPEPTLRSIFGASSPLQQGHWYPHGHGFGSTRRTKPSFGQVFSQMLDLHLLCTRAPRTREDAAAVAVNPGAVVPGLSYTWVVEVLLDELGVYESVGSGEERWESRTNREQRWAAVDIDEGRVVDAVLG